MGTTVKKHRFNAIDAVIIIALAAIIGAVILFFTAGDDSPVGVANTVKLEYVIELRNMREEFKNNVKEGNGVVDAVAKYHLGKVINVTEPKAATYTGTDLVVGDVVIAEHPGLYTVEVTVEADASVSGGRYVLDGGYDISVGSTMDLRFPYYTGRGYCTQLREVGDE